MKKILITGGELFNKGAQAMTYTTVDSMRKIFGNCKIFLISNRDFKRWTDTEKKAFNFEISPQKTTAAAILYKTGGIFKLINLIKRIPEKVLTEMDDLYKDADYMLDISGYALGSNWEYMNSITYI